MENCFLFSDKKNQASIELTNKKKLLAEINSVKLMLLEYANPHLDNVNLATVLGSESSMSTKFDINMKVGYIAAQHSDGVLFGCEMGSGGEHILRVF